MTTATMAQALAENEVIHHALPVTASAFWVETYRVRDMAQEQTEILDDHWAAGVEAGIMTEEERRMCRVWHFGGYCAGFRQALECLEARFRDAAERAAKAQRVAGGAK